MPIIPAFTISQSGLLPGTITATDTSTGSDVAIAARRIFFQTTYGNYLVPSGVTTDYNTWAYANTVQSFAVLLQDYSVAITVQWVDSGGTVLYTLTQVYTLPQYSKNFFYYLIQLQALSPTVVQDANYFSNLSILWMSIIGAINAVEFGADIAAAQNCLDRATEMKLNQSKYF